ncbi:MAG: DMT family transporter [Candidatus Hydrogenedentes bacterium]|nr:DMT family transporter [Candidatus Hydrogenedentota bacterium]
MTDPNTYAAPHQNRRAAVEAFFSALAFATMSTMVHGFGQQIAWPVVAFIRIVITFFIVLVMLRVTGAPLIIRGTPVLWVRSLVGTLGIFCTFYALTHMYVTDAVTIISTNPIWVMLILAVVFNHRLPWVVIVDVFLAVAGVFIMERPSFDADMIPMIAAVAAAFTSAVVKVSLSRLGNLPAISVVTHHTGVASFITLVVSFTLVERIILVDHVSPAVWWLLIPAGILGTAAQLLMTSAYGRGNTMMITLVSLSNIAFAAVYDVIFWDRRFDLWYAVGALMIAAAIALSVSRSARQEATLSTTD